MEVGIEISQSVRDSFPEEWDGWVLVSLAELEASEAAIAESGFMENLPDWVGSMLEEIINADLKHKITTTAPARTRKKLLDVTTGYMNLLEQSPERVTSYFGDPHVSYAACHNI